MDLSINLIKVIKIVMHRILSYKTCNSEIKIYKLIWDPCHQRPKIFDQLTNRNSFVMLKFEVREKSLPLVLWKSEKSFLIRLRMAWYFNAINISFNFYSFWTVFFKVNRCTKKTISWFEKFFFELILLIKFTFGSVISGQ